MKPSAKAYRANSSGSAFRRRSHRSKVKRIRASVVAQPHSSVSERTRALTWAAASAATTAPSE